MLGVLCLDKPAGCTSHDVVDFVRGLLGGRIKVGHGGTLDPFATGVLPVGVGKATRLLRFFLEDADKRYEAVLRLGAESDTCDIEGEVRVRVRRASRLPSLEAIRNVLDRFSGEQFQRVPVYSAVKLRGRRLHELARSGEAPPEEELPCRRVTVHSLRILEWRAPLLKLSIHCSSGTYVRSLARDIGRALGCGALLEELRRTASGPLSIEDAVPPVRVAGAFVTGGWNELFVPWDTVFRGWLMLECAGEVERLVRNGAPLTERSLEGLPAWNASGKEEPRCCSRVVFMKDGAPVALYASNRPGERGRWRPLCVLRGRG